MADGEFVESTDEACGNLVPWEEANRTDEGDGSARERHDAFNGRRKSEFLKALSKDGCLIDACRKVGVSHQTVYNHQAKDPEFARHCELALQMAVVPVEIAAWERAVMGVEEEVREALVKRLAVFGKRTHAERLAEGWTETEDGHMIPPGWVRAGEGNVGDSI
jgi:hypothetical protein